MGIIGDSVDKAFAAILADDRRKLPPEEEAAAKASWRRAFAKVSDVDLLGAVHAWLLENPKGRPNLGKIQELLRPKRTSDPSQKKSDDDDADLQWAVAILEKLSRGGEWSERIREAPYQHTLTDAERVLRRRGFVAWQDAKRFLVPGWAPSTVTEVSWHS